MRTMTFPLSASPPSGPPAIIPRQPSCPRSGIKPRCNTPRVANLPTASCNPGTPCLSQYQPTRTSLHHPAASRSGSAASSDTVSVVPKRDTACRVSSLEVIRAHIAIAAVAVQTSHAARRSLLARVEVLAVLLALAASVDGAEGAQAVAGKGETAGSLPVELARGLLGPRRLGGFFFGHGEVLCCGGELRGWLQIPSCSQRRLRRFTGEAYRLLAVPQRLFSGTCRYLSAYFPINHVKRLILIRVLE